MRLTCPNCSARYEVDDAMIPPEGRNVQCSNCVTTWFQPGPGKGFGSSEAQAAPPRPPVSQIGDADPDGVATGNDAGNTPVPRRELDPAVREILTQEAEREARLRKRDTGSFRTTTTPAQAGSSAPETRANKRSADADVAETTPSPAGRDRLPGIKAPVPPLRRREAIPPTSLAVDRRPAVRVGFFSVLVLTGLGLALYANADAVIAAIPAAAEALERFVDTVDTARFWLDDTVRGWAEG